MSKIIRSSLILLLIGAVATLIISVYSLYDAFVLFQNGGSDQANLYLIVGIASLVMSISIITRLNRIITLASKPKPEVMTTIECKKCGFKEIRKFSKGDYVMKIADNCSKCNEPKTITAIFVEDAKERS